MSKLELGVQLEREILSAIERNFADFLQDYSLFCPNLSDKIQT